MLLCSVTHIAKGTSFMHMVYVQMANAVLHGKAKQKQVMCTPVAYESFMLPAWNGPFRFGQRGKMYKITNYKCVC